MIEYILYKIFSFILKIQNKYKNKNKKQKKNQSKKNLSVLKYFGNIRVCVHTYKIYYFICIYG